MKSSVMGCCFLLCFGLSLSHAQTIKVKNKVAGKKAQIKVKKPSNAAKIKVKQKRKTIVINQNAQGGQKVKIKTKQRKVVINPTVKPSIKPAIKPNVKPLIQPRRPNMNIKVKTGNSSTKKRIKLVNTSKTGNHKTNGKVTIKPKGQKIKVQNRKTQIKIKNRH